MVAGWSWPNKHPPALFGLEPPLLIENPPMEQASRPSLVAAVVTYVLALVAFVKGHAGPTPNAAAAFRVDASGHPRERVDWMKHLGLLVREACRLHLALLTGSVTDTRGQQKPLTALRRVAASTNLGVIAAQIDGVAVLQR